jgi:hypothetical protein
MAANSNLNGTVSIYSRDARNMIQQTTTNVPAAVARRLKEGRGKGRGAAYRPYLQIHEVPSRGLATRSKSPLNGRVQHVLSQLEGNWLRAFNALPDLTDVREQFPLDLAETILIAEQLGIVHPTDPKTKELCAVTTDFLLTRAVQLGQVEMAIAIKPSSDLGSTRTLEKLEIERVYWSARNITWRILTEHELPGGLVKNMKWVQPHLDLAESGEFSEKQITRIRVTMGPEIAQGQHSLVEMAAACDDRLGLKPGAALCVARHLVGTGIWPVDLTVEIDPQKPLQLLSKQIHYDIAA